MSLEGRVENGGIILDVPASLPDGTRVRVDVVEATAPVSKTAPTLFEKMKHLCGQAKHLPDDASVNHDHYLYGTSKQQP